MKYFYALWIGLIFFFAVPSAPLNAEVTSSKVSQPAVVDNYTYPPYFYHGYWGRYPFGYGYFNYLNYYPGYWNYPNWNGFSFFAYYNYQVRYSTYGAIAYSAKEDKFGWAWGSSDRSSASQAAQNYCTFDDCQPVAWVQGGCLTVTTSATNHSLNWAYSNTKSQARAASNRSCRDSGALDCVDRVFVCSY
jgi:hypothetical protein